MTSLRPALHGAFCRCTDPRFGLSRRGVLKGAGVGAALAAFGGAGRAKAADPSISYEAMVLSCIDPRMVKPVFDYMNQRHMTGKYSEVVLGGAAIAVVAPAFESWRPAYWGNLAATLELHQIRSVIAIDHRNCGAARIAYGEEAVATPEAETGTHRKALTSFRAEMNKRYPQLTIETGLMALDGRMEMIT